MLKYILHAVYVGSFLLLLLQVFGVITLTPVGSWIAFQCWFILSFRSSFPAIRARVSEKFSEWKSNRKSHKTEAEISRQILEEERLSL
jgi:hypothetical protein